jgi:hypothetical protein
MEFEFFRPKPEDPLSCFHHYRFDDYPTLSEVIKIVGWGSNRDIRQKGFRIAPLNPGPGIIKQWPRRTDPRFKIEETSYLTSKGASVVVIHVPEKAEEANESNS